MTAFGQDVLPITSSQFADWEEHVVLACFGTGKIMDGTGQGKMIFLQITDHIGESMIAVAFGIKVFVSGNDPFDPSLRSHSIVAAFRAGQIQPFAEMLPRHKRT